MCMLSSSVFIIHRGMSETSFRQCVFVTALKIGCRRKGLWEIIHFIGSSAPELIAAIFIAQASRDEVDKGMSLFRAMNNLCHKFTRTLKFEGLIFCFLLRPGSEIEP